MGRPKTNMTKRRVHHFLVDSQIDRLDALAARMGLDRSAIIRLAVEAYLDREERKAAKGDR